MSSNVSWTFFSNHGHVYLLLATEKEITLREVAQKVGVTERTVQGIVQDLLEAKYIAKEKKGRTNIYKVTPGKTLRHPLEKDVLLKDLLSVVYPQ